jgi:lysozyme family protein
MSAYDNLVRSRLERRIAKLESALRPFADCVKPDGPKGMVTLAATASKPEDYVMAYLALQPEDHGCSGPL